MELLPALSMYGYSLTSPHQNLKKTVEGFIQRFFQALLGQSLYYVEDKKVVLTKLISLRLRLDLLRFFALCDFFSSLG